MNDSLHLRLTISLSLLLGALAGCSSSSEEHSSPTDAGSDTGLVTAPPVTTSANPKQRLADLSDGDFAKWCGDVNAYTAKTIDKTTATKYSCALISPLSSLDAAGKVNVKECETAYDKCLTSPVPLSTIDCSAWRAGAKTCPATVEQVDSCMQAQAQLTLTVAGWGRLVCDASKVSADPKANAACESLPAGCDTFRGLAKPTDS